MPNTFSPLRRVPTNVGTINNVLFFSREEKKILQEVEQIIQLVKSFFAAEDLHVSHSITL